jgi:hypothetical protein
LGPTPDTGSVKVYRAHVPEQPEQSDTKEREVTPPMPRLVILCFPMVPGLGPVCIQFRGFGVGPTVSSAHKNVTYTDRVDTGPT